MSHLVERLPDNRVKITVTVPAEQVERGMQHAAEHISEESAIPGFRPGKASYETVKQRVGEMKLLEQASEEIIRATLSAALLEEDLATVGQPFFAVEKMVPGSELIYSAEFALMPEVVKLADYTKLTIKAEETKPTQDIVDQAKKDLLRMRQKEVRAQSGRELARGDKAVVNLGMKRGGVPLEGGDASNHGVYTGEEHYIKGFVDQIVGAKEGDERTFTLKFPEDHYQKHLAGQDVDFTVKVNEIFTIESPAFDDEFAKGIGFETAEKLMAKLEENLHEEKKTTEQQRQERAALELLAKESQFNEISDLLVNQEIEKMVQELRVWVTDNGMEFNDYLKSINKTVPEMKLDFSPQALTRIKVAIVLETVAKKEGLKADEAEIDAEVDKVAESVGNDQATRERIFSPEYRDRIAYQMRNRKTIDFLLKQMVK